MVQKPLSINLLKKNNEPFVDKFIKWALTVGRFVVILTEAIALLTFLYRFTLDRQLVDLHDTIKQKLAVVSILKNNETTYRNLQERIAFASQYKDTGSKTTNDFLGIISLAPPDLVFTNIVFTTDRIRLEGSVQSIRSLSKFIDSLRNHPTVASVSIDQIENKTSGGTIIITIGVVLKNSPRSL